MKRFLKVLAVLVLVLTLAAAGVAAYGWRHFMPEAVSCQTALLPSAKYAQQKQEWFSQAQDGVFQGALAENWKDFGDEELVFWQCTLRVRNDGFFPAEWIALEPQPVPGDVMILPDAQPKVLQSRSEGDLTVTVLCSEKAAEAERPLVLSCYVLGRKTEATYTVAEGKLIKKEGTGE
ncbi:MAG: hypothetical protein IJ573_08385 [Clostridia bacterium]|nr:hypothetical protein [Clostridia bacterium]